MPTPTPDNLIHSLSALGSGPAPSETQSLRQIAQRQEATIAEKDAEIKRLTTENRQLTHEKAVAKLERDEANRLRLLAEAMLRTAQADYNTLADEKNRQERALWREREQGQFRCIAKGGN